MNGGVTKCSIVILVILFKDFVSLLSLSSGIHSFIAHSTSFYEWLCLKLQKHIQMTGMKNQTSK